MKNLNLQQKIVYPILGIFTLLGIISSWYFVSTQMKENEAWYREELRTLSAATGHMDHTAAAEFFQAKGFQFYRMFLSKNTDTNGKSEIETNIAQSFHKDPDLKIFETEVQSGDSAILAIFTPVPIKSECRTCHTNLDEDAIALFGSAGSKSAIHARESNLILFVFIATLGIIVGLGWIIHRSMKVILLEPMRELKYQTELVAKYDLRKITTPALEQKLKSDDEMGYVTRSFFTMIQMFRAALHRMQDTSQEVARTSSEISSSMEIIAAGAHEQMNQANEVAAAIEEMTQKIIENSKNAMEAVEMARIARSTAETGGKIVAASAVGMKRIAKATSKSSETTHALELSSKKIGEIVKLIDDIAGQSSLLALNAATEAARAGEKGKGFSIVADEVRKLADRTMKATKEIEGMIKMIQRDTGMAVNTMDEGTMEVQEGIKLADQAGQSLQAIIETSQKVTDMIFQIAAASKQQSITSEQISKNVEMINSVTKQTAEGAKEIAFASDDLNRLTDQLQGMVNEFKLDEDNQRDNNITRA